MIDPIAVGFAVTLERPGGNVTGLTSYDPQQLCSRDDPQQSRQVAQLCPALRLLKGAHALDVEVVEAIDHVVDLIEVQTVELDVLIKGWLSGEDVDHRPILVSVIFPCAVPEVRHWSS